MILAPNQFGAHGRPPRNNGYRPPRPPESIWRSQGPGLFLAILYFVSICSVVVAQITVPELPYTTTLPALNTSTPVLDILFPSTPNLYLTLSICSLNSNTTQIPSVLVSTSPPDYDVDDRSTPDRDSGGVGSANRQIRGGGLWSLRWDSGFANWTNPDQDSLDSPVGMRIGFEDGQEIASGNLIIQLSASGEAPLRSILSSSLYLGDTTSNQVLLFSPLLLAASQTQPTYPNYTFPSAQLDFPTVPNFEIPIMELVVSPTSSSPTEQGLDYSQCAVGSANNATGGPARGTSNMVVNATTEWMTIEGDEGYRTYWVLGGLLPGTNYTAWYTQGDGIMSQPIWFTTKQSSFPCQLVLPNPYCPGIGYAAPLEPNTTTILSSPAPLNTLPNQITSLLTSSLDSFATTLSTKACGRDFYSHVSSCFDCHTAYRDWICRTLIPRCADPSLIEGLSPDIIPLRNIPITTTTTSVSSQSQVGFSTSPIQPAYNYDQLLPCLGVCNRVDRTCPAFVQFTCPHRGVNANETYGFFGQDDAEGDGSVTSGEIARSNDRWGNRWCNGP